MLPYGKISVDGLNVATHYIVCRRSERNRHARLRWLHHPTRRCGIHGNNPACRVPICNASLYPNPARWTDNPGAPDRPWRHASKGSTMDETLNPQYGPQLPPPTEEGHPEPIPPYEPTPPHPYPSEPWRPAYPPTDPRRQDEDAPVYPSY